MKIMNPLVRPADQKFVIGLEPPAGEASEALWFAFRGRELLLKVKGNPVPVSVPRLRNFYELDLPLVRKQYLGTLEGMPCYSVELAEAVSPPEGMSFLDLREAYGKLDENLFAIANKAVQVMEWDRSTQFCSRCGTKTLPKAGERANECPKCGTLFFPRISPAVIVLIRKDQEILLARSPNFPPGIYSLVAGFVEPGESAEAAVVREVHEEVGVSVKDITYFGSQAWPFPNSLMIAFTANYESGEIRPDGVEIEDANWFSAGNMPALPKKISISRKLIDRFLEEQGQDEK